MPGKFIVIYGAPNLGKSLQVKMLEESLSKNHSVTRIKYPIYDLEPTGPILNAILREGKQVEEKEAQQIFVQNRKDYEPTLEKMLEDGTWVIAEDYLGTGIAWGLVRGLDLQYMEKINKDLLPADISIMLDGERFHSGKEETHRNEKDHSIWQKSREKHQFLAKRYNWYIVNANQTPENVHKDILSLIEKD